MVALLHRGCREDAPVASSEASPVSLTLQGLLLYRADAATAQWALSLLPGLCNEGVGDVLLLRIHCVQLLELQRYSGTDPGIGTEDCPLTNAWLESVEGRPPFAWLLLRLVRSRTCCPRRRRSSCFMSTFTLLECRSKPRPAEDSELDPLSEGASTLTVADPAFRVRQLTRRPHRGTGLWTGSELLPREHLDADRRTTVILAQLQAPIALQPRCGRAHPR